LALCELVSSQSVTEDDVTTRYGTACLRTCKTYLAAQSEAEVLPRRGLGGEGWAPKYCPGEVWAEKAVPTQTLLLS
jgi:hypothetical protein